MENFEGGTSMNTTVVSQSNQVVAQAQAPISGEFIMSPEREMPIVQTENITTKETDIDTRSFSDNLLEYTKKNGIADAFKKLAEGEDFTESSQDDLSVDNNVTDFGELVEEYESAPDKEQPLEGLSNVSGEVMQKNEIVEYIANEVDADPLFKQKLGEVASEMMANGDEIDPELLKSEAMERYLAEKNADQPMTMEGRIASIEAQFASLLEENDELKKELEEFKELVKTQSEIMNTMALALLEMAKKMHEKEEDEEEKVTMLELLIRLMGMLMLEFVKTEEENKQQQAQSIAQTKQQLMELPRFSLRKQSEKDELPIPSAQS